MESNQVLAAPLQTNRHSVISLILSLLTLLTFCGGMIPFPFTGFICFPVSFLFGLLAFLYGLIAVRGIKQKNEGGLSMAWSGILIGGFVLLCTLCMVLAIASLFLFSPDSLPPILQNYQI